MENTREILRRLVRAWRNLDQMMSAYVKANLDSNKLFQTMGQISEAICILIGEEEKDWEETATYKVLYAPILLEERRVEILMGVYRKNHPEQVVQPKPQTFSREDMRKDFRQNGGYLRETPEGGWS